jgi:hypothetical protein
MADGNDAGRVPAAGAARRATPAQHVTEARTVPDPGPGTEVGRSDMQDQIDAAAVPALPPEAWNRSPRVSPQERAKRALARRASQESQEK